MASLEKLRSEIEDKYKWDLTLMYKNEEEYQKDFDELKKIVSEIKKYKGILTKDANTLLEFLIPAATACSTVLYTLAETFTSNS